MNMHNINAWRKQIVAGPATTSIMVTLWGTYITASQDLEKQSNKCHLCKKKNEKKGLWMLLFFFTIKDYQLRFIDIVTSWSWQSLAPVWKKDSVNCWISLLVENFTRDMDIFKGKSYEASTRSRWSWMLSWNGLAQMFCRYNIYN